jgi:putative glutamine amidotransferase
MQVILSAKGAVATEISNHAGTRHSLSGTISGEVNSFHDLGFTSVPNGFEVLSTAADGSIEAVYCSKSNWLGIMWHPEREAIPNDTHSRELLGLLGLP